MGNKTKKQLVEELTDLRQRVAELEAVDAECSQMEKVQTALYQIASAASVTQDLVIAF